jgi:ferredoxin-NADP reductase
MKKHIVKILTAEFVTHNVKRFVVEKPLGYEFIAGQATEVAINKPGHEKEFRPFTFTSIPGTVNLEFIIKIYTGHDGMTEKLLAVTAGDELLLGEVFGSIGFAGPGLFIAGGAGITPFISIFRQLKTDNRLAGNTLLFANKTEADIILKDELKLLLKATYHDVIEEPTSGDPGSRINRELLKAYVLPSTHNYYVCGPQKFTEAMVDILLKLGVVKAHIILEQ